MGSNYTPQMTCESPSNDPEAKPCTHINMAYYSDDIVVMSFPSEGSTQSVRDERIIVHSDDTVILL